ncbi:hypothetical protein AN958_07646 [Leucoagaricus sp. SymC.cos]|nr:hypothetical protein AN958_07646 [Leucoagaricus sp. SymC.cos]
MSTDLQKLTVPQLKALCKDKGLTGYSKLPKQALVEKLVAGGVTVVTAISTTSKDDNQVEHGQQTTQKTKKKAQKVTPAVSQITSGKNQGHSLPPEPAPPVGIEERGAVDNGKKPPQPTPAVITTVIAPNPPQQREQSASSQKTFAPTTQEQSNARTAATTAAIDTVTRISYPSRPPDISFTSSHLTKASGEPPLKKQKLKHVEARDAGTAQKTLQEKAPVQSKATAPKTIPVVIQSVNKEKTVASKSNTHIPRDTAGTAKRYIPLVIKPKSNPVTGVQERRSLQQSSTASRPHTEQESNIRNGLFEFPSPDDTDITFKTITLPPSLSQRKFATRLAIILRDVRVEDMPSLTLTSRLFRYSAYLSAARHLKRWYPGERTDKVLEDVSVDRMNLWEYRMIREKEVEKRKEVNLSGVLGKLVAGDLGLVDDGIWRRDDVKSLVVALRFLLTRCYFCLSLNRDLGEVRRDKLVDVQEVVKKEIWCITTVTRDEGQKVAKFYVLDATCEVIGSPVGLDGRLPTRADWSSYIEKRIAQKGMEKAVDIMEYVRWTNHEEYDYGMSKIWLKRVEQEGEVGRLKRDIAKRYILACTMENSLSGRYMTSSEMEQELNGLPNKLAACQKTKETRINLFVPVHHHVESLHFMTASKQSLHPALAVVQTPSREYYILKENGMQVGCEEEGVGEVWMEIVGCSSTGVARG